MKYDKRLFKWDKQPGESSKAYHYFCLYRDYGIDRSLAKIFPKKSPKSPAVGDNNLDLNANQKTTGNGLITEKQAKKISAKNGWVNRAESYDVYLEKERRQRTLKKRNVFLDRQVEAGERFEKLRDTVLSIKYNELVRRLKAGEKLTAKDVKDFSVSDIIRISDEARKSQILGFGVDTAAEEEKIEKPKELFNFKSDKDKKDLADMINKLSEE